MGVKLSGINSAGNYRVMGATTPWTNRQYVAQWMERGKSNLLLPPNMPKSTNEWVNGRYQCYQLTLNNTDEAEEVTVSVDNSSANYTMLDSVPHIYIVLKKQKLRLRNYEERFYFMLYIMFFYVLYSL